MTGVMNILTLKGLLALDIFADRIFIKIMMLVYTADIIIL
ncbi:hypothetical protein SEHO0A_00082 [Salmonella enterica subsp. houtenae str. ATCC BAA-1581]|nr:hypothetical protein SEHO0A_00082 [Salmonella enterica subsp. houtenae str. ATCC BAA-1581]